MPDNTIIDTLLYYNDGAHIYYPDEINPIVLSCNEYYRYFNNGSVDDIFTKNIWRLTNSQVRPIGIEVPIEDSITTGKHGNKKANLKTDNYIMEIHGKYDDFETVDDFKRKCLKKGTGKNSQMSKEIAIPVEQKVIICDNDTYGHNSLFESFTQTDEINEEKTISERSYITLKKELDRLKKLQESLKKSAFSILKKLKTLDTSKISEVLEELEKLQKQQEIQELSVKIFPVPELPKTLPTSNASKELQVPKEFLPEWKEQIQVSQVIPELQALNELNILQPQPALFETEKILENLQILEASQILEALQTLQKSQALQVLRTSIEKKEQDLKEIIKKTSKDRHKLSSKNTIMCFFKGNRFNQHEVLEIVDKYFSKDEIKDKINKLEVKVEIKNAVDVFFEKNAMDTHYSIKKFFSNLSIAMKYLPRSPNGAMLIRSKDLFFFGKQAGQKEETQGYITFLSSSENDIDLYNDFTNDLMRAVSDKYFYIDGHASHSTCYIDTPSKQEKRIIIKNKLHSYNSDDLILLKNTIASKNTSNKLIVFMQCALGSGNNSFAERFSKKVAPLTVYAPNTINYVSYKYNEAQPKASILLLYKNKILLDKPIAPASDTKGILYKISKAGMGHYRIFNYAQKIITTKLKLRN